MHTTEAKPQKSLIQIFSSYLDKRILFIFLMGCSSGFPWVLIGSNMSGWLKDDGLSRSAIGYFGSIFSVYAINFLWAPLVDRVKLPILYRWLGQRRSWVLFMQMMMLLATIAIANTHPGANLTWTSLIAMAIAVASATQDIAIDAYRIDVIGNEEDLIPPGSAMAVIGWWTGYSVPGYLAFTNADRVGWNGVYMWMTVIIAVLMLFTLIIREPTSEREALQFRAEDRYRLALFGDQKQIWQRMLTWLTVTVIEPFAEFFRRNGVKVALTLLLFVFLFKIGEAFLGRMSIVFYKEIGFTNEQIGHYSKLVGWIATVIFTLIGSAINVRFGIIRGLMIGGIAMAGSNLMFAWIAAVGPDTTLLAAAIIVDNFTTAFSTVAFVAFLTWLTGRAFSATQYALLASLGNLGRTTLAAFSGKAVDLLGGRWTLFFIFTTLMVIPSLVLLSSLRKKFQHAMFRGQD